MHGCCEEAWVTHARMLCWRERLSSTCLFSAHGVGHPGSIQGLDVPTPMLDRSIPSGRGALGWGLTGPGTRVMAPLSHRSPQGKRKA